MNRKRIVVLLAAGFTLGATFAPLGSAVAKGVQDVFISNDSAHPVPVEVAATTQEVVKDHHSLSAGEPLKTYTFDTAAYASVRVSWFFGPGCLWTIFHDNDFLLDSSSSANARDSRVFDTPGTSMTIDVTLNPAGSCTYDLGVWGRS